ncbi:MAG TPA: serine hydrolase domain-containing protein [Vicinamibacterales bacterium]|nr:serine hydrolase domain-containing protein [Vicinamibacterales bacterium]
MPALRIACAAALLGLPLVSTVAPPPGWAAVSDTYRGLVERAGIVGSSLMVVRGGSVLGHVEVGLQDRDAGRPVDADTIYHWASITKTFTGIAIMQLRDRGKLSLDDPVVNYVPELREVHDPFGDIAAVKIRHLMSHSAGFRAATWPWGGDQPWHPFEPTRWEQLVAMMPYTTLLFAPGTDYSYSNPGVIFLGRIIETLSGDDYEVYVQKNILMPLGMSHTFFDRAPYTLRTHRSHSYYRTPEGLREAPFDFDTGITVSNGGLNAPFPDMAKYAAFLIGDPKHPEYDAVLKRSSLEEMWTPQIRAKAGEGASGTDSRAALSFFVERYGDVTLVGHSGDQNGFISHLYLHPPTRTAWIVSFNTDAASSDGRPGTRDVDAAVRDAIIRELLSPAGSGGVK